MLYANGVGLAPTEVKPGACGILFLIKTGEGDGHDLQHARFLRVRVVNNQVNTTDMQGVELFAKWLSENGYGYTAFSAGRNTPLPESGADLQAMRDRMPVFDAPRG